jgi:PIN domain nuclease of toxin-antitoxin system
MVLLDTHVVLWLAIEPARVSRKARAVIAQTRRSGDELAISDITLLEIAMAEVKGRITLMAGVETFLSDVAARFVVLPMTSQICVRAMHLSAAYPKDPADRVIGATAIVAGASLITADNAIRRSGALPTIW